jgi:hypothetical protein
MTSIIQAVFENKLVDDDRIPLFTFDLAGHKLGFFPMELLFWIQILTCLVLIGIFACIMWAMTYYIVIPNRGTLTSYLIGFGIIIPLMTMYPVWLLHVLDIRNKVVRFCASAMYPVITIFHTIEAMYGFSPNNVEESFSHYALYNACILDIQYEICPKTDKKRPVKRTAQDIMAPAAAFVTYLFIMGMYLSAFGPLFEPYETNANGNEPGYNLSHLWDFNLFRNNATSAFFFQLTISTFTIAVSILVNTLFGVKTKSAMHNPMFEATSPSDFWGNRWNLIIHGALKRGIFKPVYKYTSKSWAILATFLASGAFHEYLLLVVYHADDDANITFGKNTAFMVWNAGIVTIESLIGNMFVFQWMKKTLPKRLLTFLILSTALPIAHLFIHPYTKTGFFDDIIVGFCMIKKA